MLAVRCLDRISSCLPLSPFFQYSLTPLAQRHCGTEIAGPFDSSRGDDHSSMSRVRRLCSSACCPVPTLPTLVFSQRSLLLTKAKRRKRHVLEGYDCHSSENGCVESPGKEFTPVRSCVEPAHLLPGVADSMPIDHCDDIELCAWLANARPLITTPQGALGVCTGNGTERIVCTCCGRRTARSSAQVPAPKIAISICRDTSIRVVSQQQVAWDRGS